RDKLPLVRRWIAVRQNEAALPEWAEDFAEIAAGPAEQGIGADTRSGDDLVIIYTGGTTGHPKGVMWRQADLIGVGNYGANVALNIPALTSPEDAGARAQRITKLSTLVACPLMHG